MSRSGEFQLGSVTHQHMLAYGNASAAADLFVNSDQTQEGSRLARKAGRIRESATPVPREKAQGTVPWKTKYLSRYN